MSIINDTPTADEPYTTDDPVATQFHDMHSGGIQTTEYAHIFVELPEDAAIGWFRDRFGENPLRVRCHCCGPNFSVTQGPDLRQATAYERNCQFVKVEGESGGGHYIEEEDTRFTFGGDHIPFEEYVENAEDHGALIVTADELPNELRDEATTEGGFR